MARIHRPDPALRRAEIVRIMLNRGIVINAWATVAVIGLILIRVDAKILVASLATYLEYADALEKAAMARAPAVV